VQRGGDALPTFQELCQRVNANKKITVRDVWGLMLTALPGEKLLLPYGQSNRSLWVAQPARWAAQPALWAAL